MDDLLSALARNLRRYRWLRGYSSSEVAQRSQIARATLSALEAGRGNPTLDTLSAVAGVLGVGVPELIAPASGPAMTVVRAAAEEVGDEAFRFRLLRRFRAGPCVIDLYDLQAAEGETRRSEPNDPDVLKHVVVHAGELEVRLGGGDGAERRELLGAGDYAVFTTDAAHAFTAVRGPVRASLIIHYAADVAHVPVPVVAGSIDAAPASH